MMEVLVSFIVVVALFLRSFSDASCMSGTSRVNLSPSQNGGVIMNPVGGGNYPLDSKCSWYIEGNNRTNSIQLLFTSYDIECLWDRLFVYQGDSLYNNLLASITGSTLLLTSDDDYQYPLALPLTTNRGSGSGSGSGSGGGDNPVIDELIVTVPGSSVFIYFFSDVGLAGRGFNISYWINGCVDNCSNNGVCTESGGGGCVCDPMWMGSHCQYRKCPNDCSGNGQCDQTCICNTGYTGTDCSISEGTSHWSVLEGLDIIGRAGHTSVTWSDYVWVYGGYRYVDIDNEDGYENNATMEFIRYHINYNYWEEVPVESSWLPGSRHSHSAVVHNDTMYIYGGALIDNEDIVNELWKFDFNTLIWTQLVVYINDTRQVDYNRDYTQFTTITGDYNSSVLPLPVKYHTANIVNDTMYIIFGYSIVKDTLVNYIQLYDIVTKEWSISLPRYTNGTIPSGRMGHTSVYVPLLDTILVHGGMNNAIKLDTLLSYSIITNQWNILSPSGISVLFHSSILLDNSLMVIFGGYTDMNCFSEELSVYNILCDQWYNDVDIAGLKLPAKRFGHSAVNINNTMLVIGGYNGVMYQDVLVLTPQNCTMISDLEECVNETFCMWNENECLGISLLADARNVSLDCDFDSCSLYHTCTQCTVSSNSQCQWSNSNNTCLPTTDTNIDTNSSTSVTNSSQCDQQPLVECNLFKDCISCQASACVWNNLSQCVSDTVNVTDTTCDVNIGSCFAHNSCTSCTGSSNRCLWCESIHKCVHDSVYPESFLYGQCLGWNDKNNCPAENCSDYNTCDRCHGDPKCGWCRSPADNGLGTCSKGGYLATLDPFVCPDIDWYYEQCPLCNCNGHSTCVNQTVCYNCLDNTTGDNCEKCIDGFYGVPENGQNCTVCDCNGYNTVCDNVNGTCTCLDAGVTGDHCTMCDAIGLYDGDADNFCHYEMSVGFIYTFSVTEQNQKQSFYTAVPKNGNRLNVKFDITRNSLSANISVQYFIGRVSEDYILLVNVTDPIYMTGTSSISHTVEPFSSSHNDTDFFTFARDSITDNNSFISLLGSSVPNDYTSDLWDGDLGLVIFVSNQSVMLRYKITIDQNDLLFLVYFFVTFVICFALLLGFFLLGWYLKRKLERRAFIRAQHVELQRRVRRPFGHLKTVVEKTPDLTAKQNASYVSVETTKDNKAAILSLLIRLPGNREMGTPTINRTGIGFGSTLVRMNQNKKEKKENKKLLRHRTTTLSEDEHAT